MEPISVGRKRIQRERFSEKIDKLKKVYGPQTGWLQGILHTDQPTFELLFDAWDTATSARRGWLQQVVDAALAHINRGEQADTFQVSMHLLRQEPRKKT